MLNIILYYFLVNYDTVLISVLDQIKEYNNWIEMHTNWALYKPKWHLYTSVCNSKRGKISIDKDLFISHVCIVPIYGIQPPGKPKTTTKTIVLDPLDILSGRNRRDVGPPDSK